MNDAPTAPDLLRGHIVNGITQPNSWMTTIQSVLRRHGQPDETLYLSHECRHENVPFGSACDDNLRIFQRATPYEFLTFTKGDSFHQLISSDLPFPASSAKHSFIPLEDGFYYQPVSGETWKSSVRCPEAPIETISAVDLLTGLNDRALNIRDIFVHVRVASGDDLYFPANYINFANRGVETADYVQSISGSVIFPVEGTYVPGYMACAVAPDGRSRIEFAGWRNRELYGHLAQFAPQPELAGLLNKLSELAPAYFGTISLFLDVDGAVTFYRYA